MRRVVVLPAAIDDMDEIFVHTAKTWSEEQAIRYLNQLEDEFSDLAGQSSPGRPCASLQTGLRKYVIASHVIYFFATDSELTISRVLHSRMSPDLHTF